MVDLMTPEEIHAEVLAHGALTSTDDDGFIHHILRRGADYADLECAPDGSYYLQVRIGSESHSADGREPARMSQVWKRWRSAGKS